MEIIITLLILSQIYTFYLLSKKSPTVQPKEESKDIILKPIPKLNKVDEVEGFEDTIRDVLLSAKNENWDCTIKFDDNLYYQNYDLDITSGGGFDRIEISALVRVDKEEEDNKIDLGRFWIKKEGSFIRVEDTYLKNDLLVFLWDYILEDEIKKRSESVDLYKQNFENLRKSLKSLNRDRKLDELFK